MNKLLKKSAAMVFCISTLISTSVSAVTGTVTYVEVSQGFLFAVVNGAICFTPATGLNNGMVGAMAAILTGAKTSGKSVVMECNSNIILARVRLSN